VCDEGIQDIDKRDSKIRKPHAETRCGCNARLVIVYNQDNGKYMVTGFIIEHNHSLHLYIIVHMMPSK
jgi:hypothetical protein